MNLLSRLADLNPPRPRELLPNSPNFHQTNLVRSAALAADLRIDIDVWEPAPTPNSQHTLRLLLNGELVNTRVFSGVVVPADCFVMLPKDQMYPRVHQLSYTIEDDTGELFPSTPIELTIDNLAPTFSGTDRVVFPYEVEIYGITLDYLNENEDKVLVEIPVWPDLKPGDVVRWYWDRDNNNGAPDGEIELLTINPPIKVVVTKDVIQANGDGERYMSYKLGDRAGNFTSGYSQRVRVTVDLREIPRYLPPVTVMPFL